jgi:hypothetical protein
MESKTMHNEKRISELIPGGLSTAKTNYEPVIMTRDDAALLWKTSADIRAEFETFERMWAFFENFQKGRIKIFGVPPWPAKERG